MASGKSTIARRLLPMANHAERHRWPCKPVEVCDRVLIFARMTKRDPILIGGGGLGGLTTALALAQRGRATRVLEGATEFGAIGYGIQFGPNVFHVFDRLALIEEVLAVADS